MCHLVKNGHELLPIASLIEQCKLACDELIDVTGHVVIQAVLQLLIIETADESPQQEKRHRGEVLFYAVSWSNVFEWPQTLGQAFPTSSLHNSGSAHGRFPILLPFELLHHLFQRSFGTFVVVGLKRKVKRQWINGAAFGE
jgi:hypothetical protein